jgi:hypothetical protein
MTRQERGTLLDDNWYIGHRFTVTETYTYLYQQLQHQQTHTQKKNSNSNSKRKYELITASPATSTEHRDGETLRKGNDKSRGFIDLQASEY